MPLTDRQRNLLRIINQMSQNTTNVMGRNTTTTVDFPSVDFNLDFGGVTTSQSTVNPPLPPRPTTPATLRELLLTLTNEQVEVTTSFGTVSGLLLFTGNDYIVIVENGDQVLIPIEQVDLISEL